MSKAMNCAIYDFSVYEDVFHEQKGQLKTTSVGWNGRKLEIIPLFQLLKHNIIPIGDLMNLKPFDIIRFDENRAFGSYLIVPLKVTKNIEVELNDIDENLKKILLSYGIIEFEFDCSGETSCLPPEGIEAIEKHGIHYFDIIKEMEDVHGIVVDYKYMKSNFDTYKESIETIGCSFEYHKIPFIWITNEYKLTLNDASDEQIKQMEGSNIILWSSKEMNAVQLVSSILGLPDSRTDCYPDSFDLYEKNKSNVMNEIKKSKLPNFKSMKKDDLITLLIEKYSKIDELETSLIQMKNNLHKITGQYKNIKSENSDNERDSKYLNNTVSIGVKSLRQLLAKCENQLKMIDAYQ